MVKEFINKFKRIISALLLLALIFAQVPILINAYMYEFSSRYFLSVDEASKESFDCVLVLGAGVWGDGPSHLLEERLNKGIEVYKTGCTNRILMSGDHGREEYDEVNVMKGFAVEKGAVAEDVFMDHAGFSTYESMYRAKEVFQVNGVANALQVAREMQVICNEQKRKYNDEIKVKEQEKREQELREKTKT